MITAQELLNAVEGGDIESMKQNGKIDIFVDRKEVLTVPAVPKPKLMIREDNMVEVRSGDSVVYLIPTESEFEANEVADTLKAMFDYAA